MAKVLVVTSGKGGVGKTTSTAALGAALAQRFGVAFVGLRKRNSQALREQIVARVTGGDANLIGFTAEADDVVSEDDFGLHKIDA